MYVDVVSGCWCVRVDYKRLVNCRYIESVNRVGD